jgi:hypothetical protein
MTMAALKTHLAKALAKRKKAETAHLETTRRQYAIAATAANLDQGAAAAAKLATAPKQPPKR